MITMNTGAAKPGSGSGVPARSGPHPGHAAEVRRTAPGVVPGPRVRHGSAFALLARQVRRRPAAKRSPPLPAARAVPEAGTVGVPRLAPASGAAVGGIHPDAPATHTGPVAVRRQPPAAAHVLSAAEGSGAARATPKPAPHPALAGSPSDPVPQLGRQSAQPPVASEGRQASAAPEARGHAAKAPVAVALRGAPRRPWSAAPLQGAAPGSAEGGLAPAVAVPAQLDGVVGQSPPPSARAPTLLRTAALGAQRPTPAEPPLPSGGGWRISGLTLRPPALGVGVQFRLNPPSQRLGAMLVRMAASGTRAHVVLSVRNSAWLKVLAADRASLASQLEPSLGSTAVEVTAGSGFGFGSSAPDQADRPPAARSFYGQGSEMAGRVTEGAAAGLDLRA